jgi:hypothetical protein
LVVISRGVDGDRRGFTIAIAVALLASPIVWLHYLVVLLAPIALARSSFSGLWCVPLALWLSPWPHSDGSTGRTLLVVALAATVFAVALAPPRRAGRFAESSRVLPFLPRRKRAAPVGAVR